MLGLANQLDILHLQEIVSKVLYLKAPDFAVARTTLVEAVKRGLSYVAQLIREGSARPVFVDSSRSSADAVGPVG